MNCKNCNTELDEQATVCPSCGEPHKIENNEQPNSQPDKNENCSDGTIGSIFAILKRKFDFKSIFDDSIKRTSIEKKTSSKYFMLLICALALIIFWSTNTFTLKISLFEETNPIEFQSSMNQMVSAISSLDDILRNEDLTDFIDSEEVTMAMDFLSFSVFLFGLASFLVYLSPMFALLPLLQRSTSKRLWITLERICLITSLIIRLLFYVFIKIMSSSLELKLRLNFNGICFILVYIFAFICISKISRDTKRQYVYVVQNDNITQA